MRHVRTADSNMVYRGPTPDIGDLHCQRLQPGRIRSVWTLTRAERELVAAGANIALVIVTEPIPPVALEVTGDQGVGEDAPEHLERLEQLQERPRACWAWNVTEKAWCEEHGATWIHELGGCRVGVRS